MAKKRAVHKKRRSTAATHKAVKRKKSTTRRKTATTHKAKPRSTKKTTKQPKKSHIPKKRTHDKRKKHEHHKKKIRVHHPLRALQRLLMAIASVLAITLLLHTQGVIDFVAATYWFIGIITNPANTTILLILLAVTLITPYLAIKITHYHKKRAPRVRLSKSAKESGSHQTQIDELYQLIQSRKDTGINDITRQFKINKELAEEWIHILESHGLVETRYSALGSLSVRPKEVKDEKKR